MSSIGPPSYEQLVAENQRLRQQLDGIHEVSKVHVEQRGADFLLDIGAYVPKNVNVELRGITTQAGCVVVDAGSRPV